MTEPMRSEEHSNEERHEVVARITLNDVERATAEADERFATHVEGSFQIDLSVGRVNILNNRHDAAQWDYNIPLMYEMPQESIPDLTYWWTRRHPNTGAVLLPQLKHGSWIINIQWRSTRDRLFNMHVAVTAR